MTPARFLAAAAVLSAIALQASAVRDAAETTWGGGSAVLLTLETSAAAALVVAGLRVRTRAGASSFLLLGATWLFPELAGLPTPSTWLRTLFDGWGPALAALAVWAVSVSARGIGTGPGWPLRSLPVVGATAFSGRVLLWDPYLDPRCWRLCEPNPWAVGPSAELVHVARPTAQLLLLIAVVWAASAVLRDPTTGAPGGSGWARAASGCATAAMLVVVDLLAVGPGAPSDSPVATGGFVLLQLSALVWGVAQVSEDIRSWLLGLRLSRLVGALGAATDQAPLEQQLRRATGDPALVLRFWSPDRGGYVDAAGAPAEAPTSPAVVTTLVERGGRPVAAIDHGRRLDPSRLERAIDPALRLVLQNAQLRAATLDELSELTASRARLVERSEAERRQLERNLHDGAQQRAVSLALLVRMLSAAPGVDAGSPAVERIQALSRTVLGELRRVARGIYPAALADAGLPGALVDLAERSTEVVLDVDNLVVGRHQPVVESTAYAVVQAAWADAERRGATEVRVIGSDSGSLVLEVVDDGRAGLPSRVLELDDRVRALDGRLDVVHVAGRTSIRMELPCGP